MHIQLGRDDHSTCTSCVSALRKTSWPRSLPLPKTTHKHPRRKHAIQLRPMRTLVVVALYCPVQSESDPDPHSLQWHTTSPTTAPPSPPHLRQRNPHRALPFPNRCRRRCSCNRRPDPDPAPGSGSLIPHPHCFHVHLLAHHGRQVAPREQEGVAQRRQLG